MNTYTFDEIEVGQEEHFSASIGKQEMDLFCRITGDRNPLHIEKGVVYGMLSASFLSTLAGMYLPGERSLIQQVKLDFLRPIVLNDNRDPKKIIVSGRVESKDEKFRTISLKFSIKVQADNTEEKVVRGTMRVGVRE